MADDYFDAKLALNGETGNVVAGAQATVYALEDTGFTTPLEITDMSGIPLANLIASPTGIYPQFKVVSGEQKVMAKSGAMVTPLTSAEGTRGLPGDPGPAGIGLPDPTNLPDGYGPITAGGVWGVIPGGGGGGSGISPMYVVKWTGSGWPTSAGIVPAGTVIRVFDAAGDPAAVPYTGATVDGVTDWFIRPEV